MRLVVARATSKLILGLAVRFLAVATLVTGAAGVTRIDGDQRYTGEPGLVLQKQSELRKRPGVENCSLPAPNRYPFADAIQFFNGNAASGAFSAGNDLLGYHMVRVRGEALLFSRKGFKPTLGGAGLFLLQFGSQSPVPVSDRLNMRTGVALPVRITRNIGNSKINSKEVIRTNRSALGKVDCAEQIKLILPVHQIRLPFDPVEPLLLVLAIDQRNNHTLFWQRPEAYTIQSLEAHNTLVVSDRTVGLEHGADTLVTGKALYSFANGANSHLSRQFVAGSDLGVCQFVDRGLTKDLGLKSALCRERSGFVHTLHRFEQTPTLFGVWQKLQLERKFQQLGVYHSKSRKATGTSARNLFLCHLKKAVSAVQIL